jgi:hypothetical protein
VNRSAALSTLRLSSVVRARGDLDRRASSGAGGDGVGFELLLGDDAVDLYRAVRKVIDGGDVMVGVGVKGRKEGTEAAKKGDSRGKDGRRTGQWRRGGKGKNGTHQSR